jgi:hypothetical protein
VRVGLHRLVPRRGFPLLVKSIDGDRLRFLPCDYLIIYDCLSRLLRLSFCLLSPLGLTIRFLHSVLDHYLCSQLRVPDSFQLPGSPVYLVLLPFLLILVVVWELLFPSAAVLMLF